MQEDGAKVLQQLTITRDGWGYLTRFTFGSANDDMPGVVYTKNTLFIRKIIRGKMVLVISRYTWYRFIKGCDSELLRLIEVGVVHGRLYAC